jgi:hypothetical protein
MHVRSVAVAVALLLSSCSDPVDPGTVDLTGQWQAAPNALGIGTMELDLTESEVDLLGSGTYTGATALASDGTLTLTGIHVGGQINVNITFTPDDGQPAQQNFTGHVDDEDHFVLAFPTDEGQRVTFTRR